MSTAPRLRRLGLLPVLLISHSLSLPVHAQRVDSLADPVRDLVQQSVAEASSASANARLNVRRRADLESLLSTLQQQKSERDVYFYEIQSPAGTVSEAPADWVVAVVGSQPDVYRLYSFLGSAGPDAASEEFNRFTSRLALSVPEKEAMDLARLFLRTCVEGDHQETVVNNEIELRLSVQNYYSTAYGDLWRALDAYSRWWQAFQLREPDLAPRATRDTNGRYRVALNTLVTLPGMHPQVRRWELEVSGEGEIRTSTIQLLFPDQPRWLSYDLDTWHLVF